MKLHEILKENYRDWIDARTQFDAYLEEVEKQVGAISIQTRKKLYKLFQQGKEPSIEELAQYGTSDQTARGEYGSIDDVGDEEMRNMNVRDYP